ncbi:hypothetical protein [Photorhabdus bodei]|uniref:Uncharacterized protein n=1 Tax=Photorhabdus bodei TaxID=2029681 RepID=A0AAW6BU07_9GAMM|nr:hypothetical protein [Photorhabdus bodei]MDB6375147.1 hypothetical protein [Photorhabdus bodei]
MNDKVINKNSAIRNVSGYVTGIDLNITDASTAVSINMLVKNVPEAYVLDFSSNDVNINKAMALLVTLVNAFYQNQSITVGLQSDQQQNYKYIISSKIGMS